MNRGHLLALPGAALTSIGTALAMLGLMPAALLPACTTDIRTDAANVRRELRSSRHEAGSDSAYDRALMIEIDAASHHLDVCFF